MRLIAYREFIDNVTSNRFVISFVVFLLMIPFSLFINIEQYKDDLKAYRSEVKLAEHELEGMKTYSMYRPTIIKPPEALSIFCIGISPNLGNKIKIRLDEIPMYMNREGQTLNNPLLSAFFNMDFVTILSILLSLLAIVLSYDKITNEKEEGTLKLLLTNQISRSKVIFGKLLGITLTAIPLLLFAYTLSAILIIMEPDINYDIESWGRVIKLFICSLIYFIVFVLIGLFISTKFKSSNMSMFTCLFIWIFLLFIIPNLSIYIADTFVKSKESFTLKYECEKIEEDHVNNYESREYIMRKAEEMGVDLSLLAYSGKLGGISGEFWFVKTSRITIDLMAQVAKESINDLFVVADKKWKYQKTMLDYFDRQINVAKYISIISPKGLFEEIASKICNTDNQSFKSFIEEVRLFREDLIKYFETKNVLDSYKLITPIPEKNLYTPDQIVFRASKVLPFHRTTPC